MPLTALKLFKNLSDETRLGIVLLLRELENCASAISARRWMSPSPRSPSSGNAPGKRSIAGSQAGEMGSLSLIPAYSFWAAQVIEQAWLNNRTTYRPSPVSWHRQTALVAVRLFASKNLPEHMCFSNV